MITRIAVLGAGTMGHGIAHAAMSAGYATSLFDVSQLMLDKATAAIGLIADKSVELGTQTPAERDSALARLTTTTSLRDAVRDAGMVIEAVPEQIALKVSTFADVQAHAPADAVLATNTSSLSVTEIAAVLDNPGRLAGMHFFNPVHRMKLVEIVRALESSEATLAAIDDVARRMGTETVVVRESPGFITSRINAMIGNEASYWTVRTD